MCKILFAFLLFIFLQKTSFAQDTLPRITVTELGKKVLISWENPYTYVTIINIQRSPDSLKNFTTIGTVLNVKSKLNGFVDQKEFIPSTQYYRLFISFEGGTYIFTKSHRPGKDTIKITPQITEYQPPAITWFTESKHVYMGKDNNVIISLPDADHKKYSVKFFEEDGSLIFELKKIPEVYLTLDKVNFIHSGLFDYELYENRVIIEKHKIYIPKDRKPVHSNDDEDR